MKSCRSSAGTWFPITMNLVDTFSHRFYLNLGRREDRRFDVEDRLADCGIPVQRFAATDARWVRRTRGYRTTAKYACAMTKRRALRAALHAGADAVFLFEDDVVLHERLVELLDHIELPDDWGIFFLGCQHNLPPTAVSKGLVRCAHAVDNHAFGVRREYIQTLISALAPRSKSNPDANYSSDRRIAWLQSEIPSYAAFPNLAWQGASLSDLEGGRYSNYNSEGDQWTTPRVLAGIAAETHGGHKYSKLKDIVVGDRVTELGVPVVSYRTPGDANPECYRMSLTGRSAPVRIAFFLGATPTQALGRVWRAYMNESPTENPVALYPPGSGDHALPWRLLGGEAGLTLGGIGRLRCFVGQLRDALANETYTHFAILPDRAIPIKPISSLAELLDLQPESLIERVSLRDLRSNKQLTDDPRPECPFVPSHCWYRQSGSMILDRDAASALAEDDFTESFSGLKKPDDWYAPTVLAMKGFSLKNRTRNLPITWVRKNCSSVGFSSHSRVDAGLVAELRLSPCFFAWPFSPCSNVGEFGLHRSSR